MTKETGGVSQALSHLVAAGLTWGETTAVIACAGVPPTPLPAHLYMGPLTCKPHVTILKDPPSPDTAPGNASLPRQPSSRAVRKSTLVLAAPPVPDRAPARRRPGPFAQQGDVAGCRHWHRRQEGASTGRAGKQLCTCNVQTPSAHSGSTLLSEHIPHV